MNNSSALVIRFSGFNSSTGETFGIDNITFQGILGAPLVPGDTDGDGDIDADDLATLGLNWDPTGTTKTWADGDFDGDGDVDADDLATLGLNWNPTGSDAVPEPATMALLVLGCALVLLRRRR